MIEKFKQFVDKVCYWFEGCDVNAYCMWCVIVANFLLSLAVYVEVLR